MSKNKDAVEALPPQSRNTLLGNFDVAAAEAFFVAKSQKRSMVKVQEHMLEATLKYVKQLGLKEGGLICAGATWIDYTQCGQAAAAKQEDPGDDTMKAAPAVIRFDEATGQQLNSQVAFAEKQKKKMAHLSYCLGALGIRAKFQWEPWKLTKHPQSRRCTICIRVSITTRCQLR